ncbi:MAG: hypothetical protein RLY34_1159 [Actinomycetota bacterium]|jgi:hypothetical protein
MTDSESKATGKGRATPSRKQQEAANLRPLVGKKTPEARKAEKMRVREDRIKARTGMANGDEKYLGVRDRGPQKKFVRDFVDSKFTLGEMVMPALMLVILISAIDSYVVQLATLLTMWTLFIGVGINGWLLGRAAVKALEAKYGSSKVESGIKWYAAMRSVQMRPMRLPKPQVKRGTKVAP